MVRPFAQYYDTIYADKDYDADIGFLSNVCEGKSLSDCRVLEIGAGTGNHSLRLGRLVRELVATEIDEDFATIARRKLEREKGVAASICNVPLDQLPARSFDGAAAFFNVVNYFRPTERRDMMQSIAARLRTGAWFVADLWNADAVLHDPPRAETRKKGRGSTFVTLAITPLMDRATGTVTLTYNVEITRGKIEERFEESLQIHLWRLTELQEVLTDAGFGNVEFWDRRRYPATVDADSLRVWMRAVKQ